MAEEVTQILSHRPGDRAGPVSCETQGAIIYLTAHADYWCAPRTTGATVPGTVQPRSARL